MVTAKRELSEWLKEFTREQQKQENEQQKEHRLIRIEMVKESLEFSLPLVHQRGRERWERWNDTTTRIRTQIENRDYVKLLYVAAMSSLHEQKGRNDKTYVPLKESETHKGITRLHEAQCGVPPWQNDEAGSKEGKRLNEWAPWTVPPWHHEKREDIQHGLTEVAPGRHPTKILKWEVTRKNKKKFRHEKMGIQGTSRMAGMEPWIVPPWGTRLRIPWNHGMGEVYNFEWSCR